MTYRAVLMSYIWTSLSPELYAAATTVGFEKDNSDYTCTESVDVWDAGSNAVTA